MKINAVAVASSDIKRTIEFYSLLGFEFADIKDTDQHIEPAAVDNSARLMIDSKELLEEITGEDPLPGNHSSFAIQYDSPGEIDEVCKHIREAGFEVVKEPWDAFWGQRYAVVQDPDGYKIDLYAYL